MYYISLVASEKLNQHLNFKTDSSQKDFIDELRAEWSPPFLQLKRSTIIREIIRRYKMVREGQMIDAAFAVSMSVEDLLQQQQARGTVQISPESQQVLIKQINTLKESCGIETNP